MANLLGILTVSFAALAIGVGSGACGSDERRNNDDDDGSTSTSVTSSTGAGANMTVPGGPEVSLVVTPTSMTEGGSVSFTATVIDSDGLEDIVGGMLTDEADMFVYTPFTQLSAGTFSAMLSWSQLNAIEPINFQGELVKIFRAEFMDTTQKVGSVTVAVTLTCDGGVAIDGVCGSEPPCGLNVPDPTTCEQACSVLYDCGVLVCGTKNCPGFSGIASEKTAFVGDSSMGCVAGCLAQPALISIIDPQDCAGTVATLKGASPDFAEACDNGL